MPTTLKSYKKISLRIDNLFDCDQWLSLMKLGLPVQPEKDVTGMDEFRFLIEME
jgi:hypothetical protein